MRPGYGPQHASVTKQVGFQEVSGRASSPLQALNMFLTLMDEASCIP